MFFVPFSELGKRALRGPLITSSPLIREIQTVGSYLIIWTVGKKKRKYERGDPLGDGLGDNPLSSIKRRIAKILVNIQPYFE